MNQFGLEPRPTGKARFAMLDLIANDFLKAWRAPAKDRLVDHTGASVDPADWLGGYVLAVFGLAGFDRGRRALSSLCSALDLFDLPEETVRLIFVTIDPAHDTPAAMAHFLRPDFPRVAGITGETSALRSLFRACTSAPDTEHELSRCDFIYVINPDGHPIGRWPAAMELEEMILHMGRIV